MSEEDHRHRVAAERRERMRARLLATALKLVATHGPAALSIDHVISAADVSRGTFYKYFPSPDALVREVAVDVANELIQMAEKAVQRHEDPAERVACGVRLVAKLALDHPVAASFLVRLGWPNVSGAQILVEFVERDLQEGLRRGRFTPMPVELALNVVTGVVIGAANAMLKRGCASDFAEQSAAAVLRALGVAADEASRISTLELERVETAAPGLLNDVLAAHA